VNKISTKIRSLFGDRARTNYLEISGIPLHFNEMALMKFLLLNKNFMSYVSTACRCHVSNFRINLLGTYMSDIILSNNMIILSVIKKPVMKIFSVIFRTICIYCYIA